MADVDHFEAVWRRMRDAYRKEASTDRDLEYALPPISTRDSHVDRPPDNLQMQLAQAAFLTSTARGLLHVSLVPSRA